MMNETNTNTEYKILGVSDEVEACELCGKKNLKRTVVLTSDEGGEMYVGTSCAGKLLHGNKSRKNTKRVDTIAKTIALAEQLLAEGHDADKVAKAVWNRTGYGVDRRHGRFDICFSWPDNIVSINVEG